MSRIERAIEAAARKREQENLDPAVPAAVRPRETDFIQAQPIHEGQPKINITNPFLVMANDQSSPAAEQYRKLKSLIVKLSQTGNFNKSLMITSPIAGEGKSITALNLAITLAQEYDHTVLLVEADVRKPSLLKYLGIKSDKGLTDCVLDGLNLRDVLIKTGIGGLTILPAGRSVANPVELFSSNRMKTLIDEIKTRYINRYVIVDTTPLLPFAEPQYIANEVGATLLVVREGVTTADKLKKSLEILKDYKLLGVVSNCVSRVHSLQGYYGYYGYYDKRYDNSKY